MIIKLKRCPKCKTKPHYMAINNYCGYLTCIFCQKSTPTISNDLYLGWQRKAKLFWNAMIEADKEK